jgi:hypothetical protein
METRTGEERWGPPPCDRYASPRWQSWPRRAGLCHLHAASPLEPVGFSWPLRDARLPAGCPRLRLMYVAATSAARPWLRGASWFFPGSQPRALDPHNRRRRSSRVVSTGGVNRPLPILKDHVLAGAPGRTRTCDRLLRRQLLYPAELQAPKGSLCPMQVTRRTHIVVAWLSPGNPRPSTPAESARRRQRPTRAATRRAMPE